MLISPCVMAWENDLRDAVPMSLSSICMIIPIHTTQEPFDDYHLLLLSLLVLRVLKRYCMREIMIICIICMMGKVACIWVKLSKSILSKRNNIFV